MQTRFVTKSGLVNVHQNLCKSLGFSPCCACRLTCDQKRLEEVGRHAVQELCTLHSVVTRRLEAWLCRIAVKLTEIRQRVWIPNKRASSEMSATSWSIGPGQCIIAAAISKPYPWPPAFKTPGSSAEGFRRRHSSFVAEG